MVSVKSRSITVHIGKKEYTCKSGDVIYMNDSVDTVTIGTKPDQKNYILFFMPAGLTVFWLNKSFSQKVCVSLCGSVANLN